MEGMQLAKEWAGRFMAATARQPRLLVGCGLALAVWIALASTADHVQAGPQFASVELAKKEDVHNLYYAAAGATWSDIPKWWAGSWIYTDVGYYRPVTSMLFFFEQRLFDRNFDAYNRVTWLLHGLNASLIFLLSVSLFRQRPRARALIGLITVCCFTTRSSNLYFGIARAINWWPAQNDVLSLTFGLLSLLLLDLYLCRPGRFLLAGSLLAFAASIGSKEMGFIILPIALLLIWHRRRRPARVMAAFIVVAAALWEFRRFVVPHAWGPDMYRLVILRKALLHWGGAVGLQAISGVWWSLAAGAAIAVIVVVGLRRRWRFGWIAAVCLLAAGFCAQFIPEDGTWGLLLEAQSELQLWSVLVYILAAALYWRFRREEPGLFAGGALFLSFVPILQYGGQHYFYWPGAFLGLADAVFCACLWRRARELWAERTFASQSGIRRNRETVAAARHGDV
jgi:hypothetical protein